MKRIISVLICMIMLCAAAVPAFAAGGNITKAEAIFVYPKAGDPVEFKPVNVADPEAYSAETTLCYYWKDSETVEVGSGDTYQEGVIYHIRIRFTAKPGYTIANNCEFYVNGEKQIGSVGTNLAEIGFKVAKDGSLDPVTGEPFTDQGETDSGEVDESGMNIFQRVIAFFKNFFAKIALFFSSLFPKV